MKDVDCPGKSIIFLHIPKAAGTTLHTVLDRVYGKKDAFTIDGLNTVKSIEEFKGLSLAQRSTIQLLKGHMPFGLHRYLPCFWTYITMLRDPIDRVVSYYFYVMRNEQHYLHARVKGGGMTLDDFVQSGITTEINNFHVRMLSGSFNDMSFGKCQDELLDITLEHIEQCFSVVGLVEHFDESLLLLRKRLGWKTFPLYKKKNVTKGRVSSKEVDNDTREHIRKINQLDCRLYDTMLEKFQTEVGSIQHFSAKLLLFRMLNRVYGIVGR